MRHNAGKPVSCPTKDCIGSLTATGLSHSLQLAASAAWILPGNFRKGWAVLITQKTKYAIRAVFELARRREEGPTKIADIAEVQKIPVRFLEVILNQLKHAGLVNAKRGFHGGYTLKRSPDQITVSEIMHCIESKKSLHRVSCISKDDCDLRGDCAFLPMWDKAQRAMLEVFERTTVQNLLDGDVE